MNRYANSNCFGYCLGVQLFLHWTQVNASYLIIDPGNGLIPCACKQLHFRNGSRTTTGWSDTGAGEFGKSLALTGATDPTTSPDAAIMVFNDMNDLLNEVKILMSRNPLKRVCRERNYDWMAIEVIFDTKNVSQPCFGDI